MAQKNTRVASARIDKSTAANLERMARRSNTSVSALIAAAVELVTGDRAIGQRVVNVINYGAGRDASAAEREQASKANMTLAEFRQRKAAAIRGQR